MNHPLISVIVPIYNVEKYVEGCIESIINQDYENIEVFLVDDGSTDSSGRICDAYAAKDERITVIHQENQKASKARNAGLDRCKGEYISFIDGDDEIEPNIYSRCLAFIEEKDVDVVVFNCNVFRNGQRDPIPLLFPGGTVKSGEFIRDLNLLDQMGGQVCFKLFHRKCFENVRFPVGRIYSDLSISHLIYENVKNVGFLDERLYNYSIRSSGTSLTPKSYKNYHIFLGFKGKYEYARDKGLALEQQCLAKAAVTARAVHNDYYLRQWTDVSEYLEDTLCFLREHRKQILSNKYLSVAQRGSFLLFLTNQKVYRILYKLVKK